MKRRLAEIQLLIEKKNRFEKIIQLFSENYSVIY